MCICIRVYSVCLYVYIQHIYIGTHTYTHIFWGDVQLLALSGSEELHGHSCGRMVGEGRVWVEEAGRRTLHGPEQWVVKTISARRRSKIVLLKYVQFTCLKRVTGNSSQNEVSETGFTIPLEITKYANKIQETVVFSSLGNRQQGGETGNK